MATDTTTEFAPAKINLSLHVTGRRTDGLHLLDSLVVFADVGDQVTVAPGRGLSLQVTGPNGAGLEAGPDNLVLRAAHAMGLCDAALTLDKHLPVASGIGGGSADAAATLRAIARLTGRTLPDGDALLRLGADLPVCLAGRPVRMSGVGEGLTPLPALPPLFCVLVNPRVPVATGPVFQALVSRRNQRMPDLPLECLATAPAFARWLADHTRNDLAAAALEVAPVLAEVHVALAAAPGCLLARMSGSGGTHFGLFDTPEAAEAAARLLRTAHPDWWVEPARILG